MLNINDLNTLLPLACQWIEEQEARVLAQGAALSSAQMRDALRAGVQRPERVRVLLDAQIPTPAQPELSTAVQASRLITRDTVGLTLRYGIVLRPDHVQERRLLLHELVHTAQYERLGGIAPFLQRYFADILRYGYTASPLEQEAERLVRRVLKEDAAL